ncbi:hypothetical protein GWK91_06130 [Virgibacillus sp. MSP4-1]|uniref:hypothetical protein n=1 Tax=Virgibacillus sp. MSP4-1 TaxID=2700081 RepID=UPI000399E06F|nr:hypothetical protein [Virgibacillus sp. MSP4-1]QHS22552.1 hypothetical protein GWK91_06130 [Virgibacillus sp. MSP4-1]
MNLAYKDQESREHKISGAELDRALEQAEQKLRAMEKRLSDKINAEAGVYLAEQKNNINSLPLELVVIYDKFKEVKGEVLNNKMKKDFNSLPFLTRFAQWMK